MVVTNKNAMGEEQGELQGHVEWLVRELLEPAPDPESGLTPFAVEDLHVGVISGDLGTGGNTMLTCDGASRVGGDRGRLLVPEGVSGCESVDTDRRCASASCPWVADDPGAPDRGGAIWDDASCLVRLGTDGCGYQQPLEASRLALTEQAEPGGPNAGFLREDSLLVLVYVGIDDDCSASDPAFFFNHTREDISFPLCSSNVELLVPVAAHAEVIRRLRRRHPERVLVAAIVGAPIDGSWEPGDPLEGLLALRRPRPENPSSAMPCCDGPLGLAFPSPRLVELAYAFGDRGLVGSICRDDWSPFFRALARMIRSELQAEP